MDFFDSIDAMDIMEDHAKEVVSLEEQRAVEILKIYKRIAGRLRARLTQLPGESFTAQQTRVVLLQLEAAIYALENNLNAEMNLSMELLSDLSISHLVTETESFSKKFTGSIQRIDINAVEIAQSVKDRLFNSYAVSVNIYSNALRNKIAQDLQDAVISRDTPEQVIGRLSGVFDGEAWRLRRIVRTELHGIYSSAKMMGLRESRDKGDMPNLKKTLYHPMDSRTGSDSAYAERLNLIAELDEPFRYRWMGKERIFMQPPDRPNDRSVLIPYDPSWL